MLLSSLEIQKDFDQSQVIHSVRKVVDYQVQYDAIRPGVPYVFDDVELVYFKTEYT